MLLIKVPTWLSEVWQRSPKDAVVADLDLENGKLRLQSSVGKGRPTCFNVARRTSPELFAFPVTKENEEVAIEGGISEALTVTADLNDSAYKTMLQNRLETNSTTGGVRSVLQDKLIPVSRPEFLAAEAVSEALAVPEVVPGETPETEEEVWKAVQRTLQAHPEGVTCDELLEQLPSAPGFLCVRNALAAMAEPVEVGGVRCFLMRQTASPWSKNVSLIPPAALMAPSEVQAIEGPPAQSSGEYATPANAGLMGSQTQGQRVAAEAGARPALPAAKRSRMS